MQGSNSRSRTRRWTFTLAVLATACDPGGSPFDAAAPVDAGVGTDSGFSDAAVADAGPPGAVGESCRSHSGCESGYCVDAAGIGGVCTRECGGGCPDDWSCREVDVAGETRMLCVPLLGDHCVRCSSDAECVGGACLSIDGARHCAPRCTSDEGCPTGYACTPAGDEGSFCQPVSGSCTCDAANAGTSRSCVNETGTGPCWGTQTCDASAGWSACDARVAAEETCNGNDDDCDFVIDDGLDTGTACSITVTDVGTCAGVEVCGGASGFTCQGQTPRAELCNYIDDNCDGAIDELYRDVGTVCEVGVGTCFAFGAIRCRADGSGSECAAVAGTPATEACNGRDDDCDGTSDEDFSTLGEGCSIGVGACQRFGTVVCSADEATEACSATPGSPGVETCNYIDDNCDGTADDGFRDAATGLYDGNTTCGSCDIDCGAVFAGAPSAVGVCSIASGSPLCGLGCLAGAFDLNGSALDGCEFVLDEGVVYVSETDTVAADDAGCGLGPAGTGAGRYPCRSIAQGLTRAVALGRGAVWVADGNYDEPVVIADGIDLLGGYRADTWEREAAVTATVVQGVSSAGNHDRTVIAQSITSPTLFEGFIVRGSFNARASGNSYAVYAASSPGLTLRGNFIYAGRGGSGLAGSVGPNGTRGGGGGGRNTSGSGPADYDARVTTGASRCDASNNRTFTNGGVTSCGADVVDGGRGGGVTCPPSRLRVQQSAGNGLGGQPGAGPGGGAGGGSAGGHDGEVIVLGAGFGCLVPTGGPLFGEDGDNAAGGANAAAVTGCAGPGGSVVSGHWVGGVGVAGGTGSPGGGGGGGGAGGGGYCTACAEGRDRLGGVGGGGGAGGCGGEGGLAGGSGGGAFGIFVIGGAPTIRDNQILQGDGGVGGRGGAGGAGGFGGVGGQGGVEMNCGGRGGRGGDGGDGGHGAGGGGGCGGPSFGIYTNGIGSPTYCGAANNNMVAGGTAGPGGVGGLSPGTAGGAGSAGVVSACRFD